MRFRGWYYHAFIIIAVVIQLTLISVQLIGKTPSSFVLVLLPDTQYYSLRDPDTYYAQTNWIVYNKNFRNIKFVIHLGDITHTNSIPEWNVASTAHKILDDANIPYSVIPGNHDNPNYGRVRDTERYNQYFGADRFDERVWYGGHFSNTNDNNYWFFEIGELKFMIVGLEFAPRKEALSWADSLVTQYPDRRVIVTTHCYQDHGAGHRCDCGTAYDIAGSGGNTTWKEFVRRHSNIFLVVSGHVGDSEFKIRTGNLGNTVYEILTDYQFEQRNGQSHGNGWLRTLEFFPDDNRIDIRVLSVLDDVYEFNRDDYPSNPNDPVHNYSIDYDMSHPVEGKYLRLSNSFNDMAVQSSDVINQKSPKMDMAATGDFAITWLDSVSSGTHVKARNFDISGKPKFPTIPVYTNSNTICKNPDIAINESGQFVVVWEDNSNGPFDIRASVYDQDGSILFKDILVNTAIYGNQTNPSIAMTSDTTFMVCWENDTNFDGKSDIFLTVFSFNGTKMMDDLQINSQANGNQRNPEIVSLKEKVLITWESDNDSDGLFQIHAYGINHLGSEIFSEITINGNINGHHQNPSVDLNSAGDFVVVWEDDSDEDGNYQVYASGFNNLGIKSFGDIVVSAIKTGQQLRPSVGLDETGKFRVTFQDDNDGNGYYQIYSTGFSMDGTRMTSEDSTVNENAGGQQFDPVIALFDIDKYVILWQDDMNNNGIYEILAKGYDYGETYVTPISDSSWGIPVSFKLNQNYPNPFNSVTTISYDLPKTYDVTVQIYNISGRLIETLVSQYQSAGNYQLQWNASRYSSGMYFCQIKADGFQQVKKMLLMK